MKYNLSRNISILVITLCFAQSSTAQWVQTNASESDGGYIRCLASNETDLFASTSIGGLFFSTDNGTSWTFVKKGWPKSTYVISLAVVGSNLFAGGFHGGVSLSTDHGTSWTSVNTGLACDTVLAFAVIGANLFAGTYSGGVCLTTDNGTSWTSVNTGLANDTELSFAVSGTNLYAGSPSGIFRSSDYGTSWTANGLTGRAIVALAVSGSNLYAGASASGGVTEFFRSSDNGSSWTVFSKNENGFLAVSGTSVFQGGKSGLGLSTDAGANWKVVSTGLTAQVTSFAVRGLNLFAGSYSGVWRRPLSEMMGSSSVSISAPALSSSTSYPNPANETTTITYSVTTPGMVSIEVFDAFSKSVAVLVHQPMQPGSFEATFDTRALPDGVYYYRLNARDVVETKKLVVVR